MSTLAIREDATLWVPREGGQQGFMDDYTSRYCALAGGWYAGKTWAGARKHADLHLFNAFDNEGRPTFVKGLAIAQNYSLARTITIPELRQAFDEMGLSHRFVADPKRYLFELPDLGTRNKQSEILIRSADAPETITGFTVGHIWGDEVARWKASIDNPMLDALLQAKGRLRAELARVQQFNMTFTHEGDATAVFRDFEEDPKPDHKLHRAKTSDNPTAKTFAAELSKQLTPELADQYLGGIAASFGQGRVYSGFDEDRNKKDDLILADNLPLQLSMDFNINPGMHAVIGQHFDGQDQLTAVHEIHAPRMDVRRCMAEFEILVRGLGGWKWPELHLFGDASGDSKWAGTGESCWDIVIECLKRIGWPYRMKVPAANPHIADRVNAVNCALFDMSSEVHYLIHERCKNLIRDYKQMKWNKGELDKDDRKLSHASDAEGYRIHWLRPIRRSIVMNEMVSVL